MEKILCLDFDGVICNSIKECFITSFVAYNKLTNNSTFDLKKEINSTFDPLKQSVEELSENIKNSSKVSRLFFWKK